jgi:hypothetical protein
MDCCGGGSSAKMLRRSKACVPTPQDVELRKVKTRMKVAIETFVQDQVRANFKTEMTSISTILLQLCGGKVDECC